MCAHLPHYVRLDIDWLSFSRNVEFQTESAIYLYAKPRERRFIMWAQRTHSLNHRISPSLSLFHSHLARWLAGGRFVYRSVGRSFPIWIHGCHIVVGDTVTVWKCVQRLARVGCDYIVMVKYKCASIRNMRFSVSCHATGVFCIYVWLPYVRTAHTAHVCVWCVYMSIDGGTQFSWYELRTSWMRTPALVRAHTLSLALTRPRVLSRISRVCNNPRKQTKASQI